MQSPVHFVTDLQRNGIDWFKLKYWYHYFFLCRLVWTIATCRVYLCVVVPVCQADGNLC